MREPSSPVLPAAAAGALRERIRDKALALGFDAFGCCEAALGPEARHRLADFLAGNRHGEMGWLAERTEQRADPRALWAEARSVLSLGLNYAPEGDALATLARPDRGNVSVYARHRDYHDVVKGMLKHLAQFVVKAGTDALRDAGRAPESARPPGGGPEERRGRTGTLASKERGEASKGGEAAGVGADPDHPQVKVFVDTAPVMEKPLAERAGLGWQGKHTNLVSRRHGSWLFLGEIYTTLALPPSPPSGGSCGSCTRCLSSCPTDAFPAPFQLDARRCISYLTIEHAGPIPPALRPLMGNRIYGCDDCLAVCPWNRFASAGRTAKLQARAELDAPHLAELSRLDDAGFRRMFSGSPIKRIGRDRFVRNVLIAIGNSQDPALLPSADGLRGDPNEVVAEAAAWACDRLATGGDRGGDRGGEAAAPPGARTVPDTRIGM
ncbi:tRNA epoxyqueuosine(34) reductase QueG [Acetobacteraceae bacterium KSS12]|uniref:Epoxyqueuosine reductase n=1 Tax=Rhizosaccharibacter radicis TaxID=2782605 RepID=A0ABT1VTL3_9PROT|nr:tRNA epoxyqueuosine(34) reductase QueG [Acetobacteraceae bacterium KSS12]